MRNKHMTENQRLKSIRKFLKVTQVDFGASIGLTQAGYSDIERGKNSVSGKIKILLQREHNINLHWLKTGEGEMFTATIGDNEFNSEQFANYQKHFEKLQLEIESLKNEVKRLSTENNLCSELVKSKSLIIENLEAQVNRK